MKTLNLTQKICRTFTFAICTYFTLSADQATAISAEYKCTSKCSLCIIFDKKNVVCSEKYEDDSAEFEKAKKLSRFVNEGLINPPVYLKGNFNIDKFAHDYYKCDLMVKKVEQIQEATRNLCMAKTVKYQKTMLVPRMPAQVKKKK